MQDKSSPRIPWIDTAKGLGVLLVVYGHSRLPNSPTVYLFHMPLFMLLSGFLYKESRPPRHYLRQRVHSLYLPFLAWNLLATAFLLLATYFRGGFLPFLKYTIKNTCLILVGMGKEGSYMGATWFIGALLLISLAYKMLDWALRALPGREYLLLVIFGGIALFGSYVTLPTYQSRTLVLSFFFAAGRVVRKWLPLFDRLSSLETAVVVGLVFWFVSRFTTANLAENRFSSRSLFLLCAFLGSWCTCEIARWITDFSPLSRLSSLLRYFGRRSMDSLLWHFIAFRLIVFLQIALEGGHLADTLFVNSRYDTSGAWWVAYFASGLVLPFLFGEILRRGPWHKALLRLHFLWD